MDLRQISKHIELFDNKELFTDLGWEIPSGPSKVSVPNNDEVDCRIVAALQGVKVFEIIHSADNGALPSKTNRLEIARSVTKISRENICVFLNSNRTKTVWSWFAKGKLLTGNFREHAYLKGQPTDLFTSKILNLYFDFGDFDDDGNVPLAEVTDKLKTAMDVKRVTKKFFGAFTEQRLKFVEHISGIEDAKDRQWFASTLLNRLMFIWFLQKKSFLDGGDAHYLKTKISQFSATDSEYFDEFLQDLFFEGFAKKPKDRSAQANQNVGTIPYLNGGLFLKNRVELKYEHISVKTIAFKNLYKLFDEYSWNLDDTPGGQSDEINPDVLGYIFEKYINQKGFGAYYTPPDITEYMCEQTIQKVLLNKVNGNREAIGRTTYSDYADMILHLDEDACETLWKELQRTTLLDPACGSGAFLVAAMKVLHGAYAAVIGQVESSNYACMKNLVSEFPDGHATMAYAIKKAVITNNLYGVDIMPEAAEIAKLRLFMTLVATAKTADELEPLPNIDFNIQSGNSLVGLLNVDYSDFTDHQSADLFHSKSFSQLLDRKNEQVARFKAAGLPAEVMEELREGIKEDRRDAYDTMNEILRDKMGAKKIKYKSITWDVKKNKANKPVVRALNADDIAVETPFHWGYDFDEVMNKNGGFDAIITNPPWDIFKPNSREFFAPYSIEISIKKMKREKFDPIQQELCEQDEIKQSWEKYLSSYGHMSSWYSQAEDYEFQVSKANGRKVGSDINLYKLFLERCYRLLRVGGVSGNVIPSGYYTDLGAKGLRELTLEKTQITGLFGFENRKAIFEGVHRSYKFIILTFEKGGETTEFPAAFMRHNPSELRNFPATGAIEMTKAMIVKVAPDSLSFMEFKSEIDKQIVKKMLRFPMLGEELESNWNVKFSSEFHMTNDRDIFKTESGPGRLPLYEGKMIWQFEHGYAKPRYWVDLKEGRSRVIGSRNTDEGQFLNYQYYRLVFRDVTASTNERSFISAIIPGGFIGNTLPEVNVISKKDETLSLVLLALFNSYVSDWYLRSKITNHINFFYLKQLPIPRLKFGTDLYYRLNELVAQLICNSEKFEDLAKRMGLKIYEPGVSDPEERAKLRAEIDAIVAHVYGLSKDEFEHILSTFPIVDQDIKDLTLETFGRKDLKALALEVNA